jgi:hypothetical protein
MSISQLAHELESAEKALQAHCLQMKEYYAQCELKEMERMSHCQQLASGTEKTDEEEKLVRALTTSQDIYVHLTRLHQKVDEFQALLEHRSAIMERLRAEHTRKEKENVVFVQLLSGEVLEVSVRDDDEVREFPSAFALQHKYNPSVIPRMRFMVMGVMGTEEPLEMEKKKRWADEFPDGLPRLHFLLQDDVNTDPQARYERTVMLRNLLDKEHMWVGMDDDELYSTYSSWLTRYVPVGASNRYLKIVAFIDAHRDIFPILSSEEYTERLRRFDEERNAEYARRAEEHEPVIQERIRQEAEKMRSNYMGMRNGILVDFKGMRRRLRDNRIVYDILYHARQHLITIHEFIQAGVSVRMLRTLQLHTTGINQW